MPSASLKNADGADEHDGIRAEQAGYLFIRAADGRHVEGRDLDMLDRAQTAVDQTRATLRYGRANVIGASDEAIRRHHALREATYPYLEEAFDFVESPDPIGSVTSIEAGAARFLDQGNCSEHAAIALVLAGRTMKDDETMFYATTRTKMDHGWAVISRNPLHAKHDTGNHGIASRTPTPDDVVMDAWAEGPAVFAGDGTFSKPDASTYERPTDRESAQFAGDAADIIEAHLRETTTPENEIRKFSDTGKPVGKPGWRQDEIPSLDRDLARSVLDRLDQPAALIANEDGSVERLRPAGGDPVARTGAEVKDDRVELRKAILAASVARSLGKASLGEHAPAVSVADAARMAPEIIEATERLAGPNKPSES
ncbi:hypothetical protein CY652_12920 [Burkholderia sp. WAC0059]|nr:hypothetical protein CY652_12920 [Burkholderia sp. WAC0059]